MYFTVYERVGEKHLSSRDGVHEDYRFYQAFAMPRTSSAARAIGAIRGRTTKYRAEKVRRGMSARLVVRTFTCLVPSLRLALSSLHT